jgi:uncharacterized protein YkwD
MRSTSQQSVWYTIVVEHKIIIGMIGVFFLLTAAGVGAVYISGADFSKFVPINESTNKPLSEKADILLNGPLDPQPEKPKASLTTKSSPSPTPKPSATSSPSATAEINIDTSRIYSLINAHRKEHNQSSLRIHAALELSAQRKMEDMRANKYWQHENRDGVITWELFEQSGYHYSAAGENLSFGNNSAWAVFDGWVNSDQHNRQMLSPEYEDMGLAVDCENYQEAGQKKCAVVLHLGKQQL